LARQRAIGDRHFGFARSVSNLKTRKEEERTCSDKRTLASSSADQTFNLWDTASFLGNVREAESGIPDVRLELEPYVKTDSGTVLHFRLHNEGYKLLTLQSISAAIPDALRDPAWHAISVAGHLEVERKMIDDVFYYCEIYLAANSVPDRLSGGYDFKVLRPVLLPSKEPADLFELRFALNSEVEFKSEYLIRYRIETTEFKTPESKISMSSVPR
jgi:hypothetical protein